MPDRHDLPLDGIRILDLSRVLAGPLCTQVLGDLGADVIKVEHPARGDDTRDWGIRIGKSETSYYYAFNRNKRSVTLDLSTAEGVEHVKTLARDADVVVENFRNGGMEKFGLDYETLRKINPKLIYCAIAGYDRYGPEADRPGYDLVVQGESGLMSINGEEGRPRLKFGVAVVDMFTGMYAAQAIIAALLPVQKTGTGRRIDLALFDTGMTISAYYGLDALIMQENPLRFGNRHPSVVPYGVFQAEDGPLVMAIGNNKQFRVACEQVLERPDIARDARFTTNLLRMENRDALEAVFEPAVAAHPRAYLLERLAALGIPCGEVLGLYEALARPRARATGLINEATLEDGKTAPYLGSPWRFDGNRLPARTPPTLGQDTEEVLRHGWGKR
jgi:crotonobetainyl-CoA:carnitine CoA-transferase CaiB-like acyl-CoA transferase